MVLAGHFSRWYMWNQNSCYQQNASPLPPARTLSCCVGADGVPPTRIGCSHSTSFCFHEYIHYIDYLFTGLPKQLRSLLTISYNLLWAHNKFLFWQTCENTVLKRAGRCYILNCFLLLMQYNTVKVNEVALSSSYCSNHAVCLQNLNQSTCPTFKSSIKRANILEKGKRNRYSLDI